VPRLTFTSHLDGIAPEGEFLSAGETVGAVLDEAFAAHPGLEHYVLDDQRRLRKHVIVFVGDRKLGPASLLEHKLQPDSDIYVLQALSGGCGAPNGTTT